VIPLEPVDALTVTTLIDNVTAARFPRAFIQNSVGTRFEFTQAAG